MKEICHFFNSCQSDIFTNGSISKSTATNSSTSNGTTCITDDNAAPTEVDSPVSSTPPPTQPTSDATISPPTSPEAEPKAATIASEPNDANSEIIYLEDIVLTFDDDTSEGKNDDISTSNIIDASGNGGKPEPALSSTEVANTVSLPITKGIFQSANVMYKDDAVSMTSEDYILSDSLSLSISGSLSTIGSLMNLDEINNIMNYSTPDKVSIHNCLKIM